MNKITIIRIIAFVISIGIFVTTKNFLMLNICMLELGINLFENNVNENMKKRVYDILYKSFVIGVPLLILMGLSNIDKAILTKFALVFAIVVMTVIIGVIRKYISHTLKVFEIIKNANRTVFIIVSIILLINLFVFQHMLNLVLSGAGKYLMQLFQL